MNPSSSSVKKLEPSGNGFLTSLKAFDLKTAALVLPFLAFGFWLWADAHNDTRYLKMERYERDQQKLDESLKELKTGQQKLIDHLLNKK
jgi:hypothetical protein